MGKTEKNYCLFKKFPQGPIVKSVNFLDGSIVVKHLAKKKNHENIQGRNNKTRSC